MDRNRCPNSSESAFRVGGGLVAEKLGVTIEEADRLKLKHIRPRPKVPVAKEYGPPTADLIPRTGTKAELSGEIALLCNNAGYRIKVKQIELFLELIDPERN